MINIKKLIEYSEKGILSKQLTTGEKVNLTLFCMAKKTEISDHTSTKEGFVYIIEGKGIFNLGEEKIEIIPGIFIFLKKNVVHSLKAEENTSFILSLIND